MGEIYKVETEEIERKIIFLSMVDPKFVSIVRHGANRTPFKVVKSDDKRGDCEESMMIVQSIIVPKNLRFETMTSKEGLQWLSDASLDKCEKFDDYNKYHQLPVEKFDNDSITMVKLDGQKGVYALTGKLKDKSDEKEALTLGIKDVEKIMTVHPSAAQTAVAQVKPKPYAVSFSEMFEHELDDLLRVVRGTLSQSGISDGNRKKTVLGAMDAFKSFLGVALDAVSSGNTKKADSFNELDGRLEEIQKAITQIKGGEEMPEVKKENIKKMIEDVFAERDKVEKEKVEREKAETEKADAEKADAEKADIEKAEGDKDKKDEKGVSEITSLAEKVDGLVSQISELATKQENYGNQLLGNASTNSGDVDTKKQPEKKKSVFSGMLTK